MIPTDKDSLKTLCLQNLGSPVIEINIADSQVDNVIDQAILELRDVHYDMSENELILHELTQTEIDNKKIELNQSVFSVMQVVFPNADSLSGDFMTNIFQFYEDLKYDIIGGANRTGCGLSLTEYSLAMQYLENINSLMVVKPNFEYHYTTQQLTFPDNNTFFDNLSQGDIVPVLANVFIDGDTFENYWSNKFLIKLSTCLLGMQWGVNLSKYQGLTLAGGVELNGQSIYDRYKELYDTLKEEIISETMLPISFLVG